MNTTGTLIIIGALVGLGPCSKTKADLDESKKERAELLVRKHAFEHYAMWITRPRNTGLCPTAAQLAEFGGDAKDPWGSDLVITCDPLPPDAVGIAISSPGPDRKAGTADDIRSWD